MFTRETLEFLKDLKANNARDWFQGQKPRYDRVLRGPATDFCAAFSERIGIQFNVETRCKLFRIHRDLRFSTDKTPYNTHIHMSCADPETGAGWMVGVEIDRLVIGYGLFAFDKPALQRWRGAVSGPAGAELAQQLSALRNKGMRLSDPDLKRVPAPYDKDHPQADLLRRKGIAIWQDLPVKQAFGVQAPENLVKRITVFDPLRNWMAETMHA